MKILLLTQVLSYLPDSGPKVKTSNVLKYLAQQHEVTLVSFVRGDQAEQGATWSAIARRCIPCLWSVARYEMPCMGLSFLTRQPLMMLRDDRKAM